MFTVGPTFFSALGDHAPSDGLTRLQTLYAGASAADVSSFAIGAGTTSGLTTVAGSESGIMDGTLRYRLWDADMGLTNRSDPYTFEFFFNADIIDVSPGNAIKIAQFTLKTGGVSFYLTSNAYAPNGARNIDIDMTAHGLGDVYVPCEAYDGTKHHIVMTNKTGAGLSDIYVDGARQVSDADFGAGIGVTSQLQLGSNSNGDTRVTYYGVRVRRAVMYTGASFARLSGPEAWGPP